MGKIVFNKNAIIEYLQDFLEKLYDIEFEDVLFYNFDKGDKLFLCYYILYHGKKEKVIKSIGIGNFITLLRLAIKSKKHFIKPVIDVITQDELKCKVNYQLTDDCGRRRRK